MSNVADISVKTKTVAVDDLIPYVNNSRTHSDEQVTQIAASIKEFGFLNPVIVDGASGIIAGHGRVMAAKKLGLKQVPCIEASHLSEAQKKAYIIADNKLALNSDWDESILKLELEALSELNFDLNKLGFAEFELSNLFDDGVRDDTEPNESLAEEIDVGEFAMQHQCPKCGFEFND